MFWVEKAKPALGMMRGFPPFGFAKSAKPRDGHPRVHCVRSCPAERLSAVSI